MGAANSMPGKMYCGPFYENKSGQSETAYFFKDMKLIHDSFKHPKANAERLVLDHNPSYIPFLPTPNQKCNTLVDNPIFNQTLLTGSSSNMTLSWQTSDDPTKYKN